MKLCIHIGLHKTGSTSFQSTCFASAGRLAELGVCYPTDGPFVDGPRHGGLAAMLADAPMDEIAREFDRLADSGRQFVTLSSEELSSALPGMDPERFRAFMQILTDRYAAPEFWCVVRPERELLASGIREYIEAVGFPYDGYGFVATYVNDFFARVDVLRARLPELRMVSFPEIAGERLANRLLTKMTGADFDLPEIVTNRTADKGALSLLVTSQMRLLLFNLLGCKDVYDPQIDRECAVVLDQIALPEHTSKGVEIDFGRWLDVTLDRVMAERSAAGATTAVFEFSDGAVGWRTRSG